MDFKLLDLSNQYYYGIDKEKNKEEGIKGYKVLAREGSCFAIFILLKDILSVDNFSLEKLVDYTLVGSNKKERSIVTNLIEVKYLDHLNSQSDNEKLRCFYNLLLVYDNK